MSHPISPDYTQTLRSLMQHANIPSFKALSRMADVSEWQVEQLRRGKGGQIRVDVLHRLSQALQVSLEGLLTRFSDLELNSDRSDRSHAHPDLREPGNADEPINLVNPAIDLAAEVNTLRQEYQRLQAQLHQQHDRLQQEFQQASLQVLESWLIQFPTAAYAAQQNPQVPATRLLPLMRPIEQLLKTWDIEPIAAVGAEIPYDPQHHQLMDGTAQPGDAVRVRYTGYRQGDKLLYRAKVSPVAATQT